MPNPIHLMWEQLKMNGKELPKKSFEKFTVKTFVNNMKAANDLALINYAAILLITGFHLPDFTSKIWTSSRY